MQVAGPNNYRPRFRGLQSARVGGRSVDAGGGLRGIGQGSGPRRAAGRPGDQDAAGDDDGDGQPTAAFQMLAPQKHAEEAGEDDGGVGQVGRHQGFAVAIGAGHGELGTTAEEAHPEQDDVTPQVGDVEAPGGQGPGQAHQGGLGGEPQDGAGFRLPQAAQFAHGHVGDAGDGAGGEAGHRTVPQFRTEGGMQQEGYAGEAQQHRHAQMPADGFPEPQGQQQGDEDG